MKSRRFSSSDGGPKKDEECDTIIPSREAAIAVLERLLPSPTRNDGLFFEPWFSDVEARTIGGGDIDCMELLVLAYVLRSSRPGMAVGEQHGDLRETLVKMRRRLTGERIHLSEAATRRLSRFYLTRQSRDVQAMHAAIFREATQTFTSAIRELYHTYLPRLNDAVVAATVLLLCLRPIGREIVVGAAFGHGLGSLIEHTFHKFLGHASKTQLVSLACALGHLGDLGRVLARSAAAISYSHGTIHHASYARNYVDRFAPGDRRLPTQVFDHDRRQKKEQIDAMVRARGSQEAADIVASDYGTVLTHPIRDACIVAPFAAFAAAATGLLANLCGAAFSMVFVGTAVVVSLLFLPASHYVHPYLHMTRLEALKTGGWLRRRLLGSRYIQHVAHAHYVHHRDASVNQNLIPGADFILGFRAAQVDEVLTLRRLGTFY